MFGILTAKIQIIFGKPPFFHKKLLVIPYSDKVAGLGEGCPRDVEPAGAGEELVGNSGTVLLLHAVLATNIRIIFENTTQHNTFLNINFNRKCCPFHTKTHQKREKWRLACSLMPSNMTSRARIRLHGGKILSI